MIIWLILLVNVVRWLSALAMRAWRRWRTLIVLSHPGVTGHPAQSAVVSQSPSLICTVLGKELHFYVLSSHGQKIRFPLRDLKFARGQCKRNLLIDVCGFMQGVLKVGQGPPAQSRFTSAVFDSVLGILSLARHTWRCPCFSVFREATHEASGGPLKVAMSA